jgi:hypothetical protein
MNHPIAQAVSLVCHANAALRGIQAQFWPSNSTAQFCEFVRFVAVERTLFVRRRETCVAQTPDDWFAWLAKMRCVNVRLGAAWALEVRTANGRRESWTGRWEVGDRNAADSRIWRVWYRSAGRARRSENLPLGEARAQLTAVLEEIHEFAGAEKVEPFAGSFQHALDSLAGGRRTGYHQDLAPTGFLSDEASAVLDACQSAWVFGGMGSWNDLGFKGEAQRRYLDLSERLLTALTSAIVAAVNESGSGGTGRLS